jgi:hypothetical protein
LNRQVDRLKPAVTAGPDMARTSDDFVAAVFIVCPACTFDETNTGKLPADRSRAGYFHSLEFWNTLARAPPGSIGSIKNISPRRQAPGFVDR